MACLRETLFFTFWNVNYRREEEQMKQLSFSFVGKSLLCCYLPPVKIGYTHFVCMQTLKTMMALKFIQFFLLSCETFAFYTLK